MASSAAGAGGGSVEGVGKGSSPAAAGGGGGPGGSVKGVGEGLSPAAAGRGGGPGGSVEGVGQGSSPAAARGGGRPGGSVKAVDNGTSPLRDAVPELVAASSGGSRGTARVGGGTAGGEGLRDVAGETLYRFIAERSVSAAALIWKHIPPFPRFPQGGDQTGQSDAKADVDESVVATDDHSVTFGALAMEKVFARPQVRTVEKIWEKLRSRKTYPGTARGNGRLPPKGKPLIPLKAKPLITLGGLISLFKYVTMRVKAAVNAIGWSRLGVMLFALAFHLYQRRRPQSVALSLNDGLHIRLILIVNGDVFYHDNSRKALVSLCDKAYIEAVLPVCVFEGLMKEEVGLQESQRAGSALLTIKDLMKSNEIRLQTTLEDNGLIWAKLNRSQAYEDSVVNSAWICSQMYPRSQVVIMTNVPSLTAKAREKAQRCASPEQLLVYSKDRDRRERAQ